MVKKNKTTVQSCFLDGTTAQPSLASVAAANADSDFKMQQRFSEWTSAD